MGKENVVAVKSFDFALEIIGLYKAMQDQKEYVISRQVLRSGTSIGANVEEGGAAQTKKDFIAKMSIASKEARETKYWLRLIRHSKVVEVDVEPLLLKSDELIRILTSIVKTAQSKAE